MQQLSYDGAEKRNGNARPALIEHTKYVFDQLANDVALAREKESLASQVINIYDEIVEDQRAHWLILLGAWFGGVLPLVAIIIVGGRRVIQAAKQTTPSAVAPTSTGGDIEMTDALNNAEPTTSAPGWLRIA